MTVIAVHVPYSDFEIETLASTTRIALERVLVHTSRQQDG